MTAVLEDPRRAGGTRPSWGAVADVIGHCVLVFAFVPPLAALPRWVAFEVTNPFNRQDAIVLAFVPARGLLTLLDAFSTDVVQRILAGALAGILLSAFLARHGRTSSPRQRVVFGALSGALAACLAVSAVIAPQLLEEVSLASFGGQVAFAAASGALCAMIAAPTAYRFLGAWVGADAAPLVTSAP